MDILILFLFCINSTGKEYDLFGIKKKRWPYKAFTLYVSFFFDASKLDIVLFYIIRFNLMIFDISFDPTFCASMFSYLSKYMRVEKIGKTQVKDIHKINQKKPDIIDKHWYEVTNFLFIWKDFTFLREKFNLTKTILDVYRNSFNFFTFVPK